MEQEIAVEAEILIEHYIKASSSMVETQNYFLNGIQAGPTAKSYLLTGKGVEVLGEEVISVPEFIESVFIQIVSAIFDVLNTPFYSLIAFHYGGDTLD